MNESQPEAKPIPPLAMQLEWVAYQQLMRALSMTTTPFVEVAPLISQLSQLGAAHRAQALAPPPAGDAPSDGTVTQ